MLTLLLPFAFAGIFFFCFNHWSIGIRQAFLWAAVIWGTCLVVITEGLSLFRAVTPLGLALCWGAVILLTVAWASVQLGRGLPRRRLSFSLPQSWSDRLLLAGIAVILGITALIACLAPPQTWDSLNYHLSRVAHWAQLRAVQHFATGIEVQNVINPGAEMAMLNLYVLGRGDRWVTFVDWFAFVGSLVAVSLVAKKLGASSRGQLLAALFAATLPMAIIQASSTVTDIVVAFWVSVVACETVCLIRESTPHAGWVILILAAGLALLTKPTAVVYLLPFAAAVAYTLVRRQNVGRVFGWGGLAIVLVFGLNAGTMARNYTSYHNLFGDRVRLNQHANGLPTPAGFISNLLRNAGLHASTPWPYVNKGIGVAIQSIHQWLRLDLNDPRTSLIGVFRIHAISQAEDVSGNPAHFWLLVVLGIVNALAIRRVRQPAVWYTLMALSAALLFCIVFKWQNFGSRYHLPFFVLIAPAAGMSLAAPARRSWVGFLVGCGLLLAAIPWLVNIPSRPLIPLSADAPLDSILVEPRQRLYFANGLYLMRSYTDISQHIREAGCTQVGLALQGLSAEYPLWVLLGAPREDLRIEWLVRDPPSGKYFDPNFQPCAIICERCPAEMANFRGLPRNYDQDDFQLFLVEQP